MWPFLGLIPTRPGLSLLIYFCRNPPRLTVVTTNAQPKTSGAMTIPLLIWAKNVYHVSTFHCNFSNLTNPMLGTTRRQSRTNGALTTPRGSLGEYYCFCMRHEIYLLRCMNTFIQSQSFTTPSQPAVANFEVSWGCQIAATQTRSWAFHLESIRVVFQSQMQHFPSPSPLTT